MKNRLLLVGLALTLCSVASAQEKPFTGSIEIALSSAAYVHSKTGPVDYNRRAEIVFVLEAEDGKWLRGLGRGLNVGDHFAYVEEAQVTAERMHLKLGATIAPDMWVPGGDASYTVELKRHADGRLEGTYEGMFRETKVSGAAHGRMRPPRPIRVRDFVPLQPGEHPRLMFRKQELPRLKEKLKTTFGQAFLEKAKAAAAGGDPVSNGMLWQLTGEKKFADAAIKILQSYEDLAPDSGAGTGGVGHRFVAVAHTLDLCWDAWPEGSRNEFINGMINDLYQIQRCLQVAGANFHPCSNFYGPARGSTAIASLLFFDSKGPEPKKPNSPDEVAAKGDLAAELMARSGVTDSYQAIYPKLLAKYQVERAEWARMGGADLFRYELFLKGFQHMNRHYREGIGDGGFAAETGVYSAIAPRYPLFYAAYYLRCFGRNPSPYPDITHHLSRRLMQCVFPPLPPSDQARRRDNEPLALKINSIAGFSYGGVDWLAGAFPLVPDEHKPALLWTWNWIRNVKADAPETFPNILPDGESYGTSLAHAFVNYPLEMKPAHPKNVMPLTWQAPTMGLYLHRSGWDGPDDFVAQVFGKCMRIGGWNHPNAGTFNLWGLGHEWATCNPERLGFREQENVVLLPEDKINAGASGYVSHFDAKPDGSGSLTLDLRDLYGAARTTPRTVKAPPKQVASRVTVDAEESELTLPVRNSFNERIPENWADSGISGLRAFAFDYSGKSGAPCLMVMVDKTTGAKKRVWTWHLARDARKAKSEAFKDVKVEPGGFVLDHGDAFLKATFIAPQGVRVERKHENAILRSGKGVTGRAFAGFVDRIQAESDGDFFVVLTVQRKDAPPVKTEGSGLDAKVTVGGQTVRFDGAKIIIGQ